MKKAAYIVLLIFFICLLCYSAWELLDILGTYRQGEESYQDLEQYVSFQEPAATEAATKPVAPSTEQEAQTEPESPTEPTEAPEQSEWPQVDFEQLAQINPDVVGWIYIKDTKINYPIVQGSNNDKYLHRLFDGTYNSSGCIFLDAACEPDFSGQHSIIYGHNMKNGSMFADLMKYKDQTFFEEHAEGLLITPEALYTVTFFSGYVSDNWTNAWELDFRDITFEKWLDGIERKSLFKATELPDGNSRVLTLSTCSYEFDNAKYVLHGYVTQVVEFSEADN